MLRAIIVDDEELSIKRLRRILSESGKIEKCDAFMNPLEAYDFAMEHPIDVAFLDISMPEINGMTLSGRLLDHDPSINVVFVTGHDNYAVKAFDMSALDYLLKPVTVERMAKTLNKLEKKHSNRPTDRCLEVKLFNGFKAYRPGPDIQALKLRSPKTEELFAFLIYRGAVSREEIVDTLWTDLEPEKAWKNLNSTLYYIRKAITDSKLRNCIESGKNEIRIDRNGINCDLYAFERLLQQFRLSPDNGPELFEHAEALYAGQLLKGKAYEWAAEKARHLERSYIELLEAAASCHNKRNEPLKALRYSCEILKLDAMREDVHYEAIRLYAALGRKSEALRQYGVLEEMLKHEFGTKPHPRIRRLIMDLESGAEREM